MNDEAEDEAEDEAVLDRCIFLIDKDSQNRFSEQDEIFSGAQLGRMGEGSGSRLFVIVDGLVAVEIVPNFSRDLAWFYARTWARYRRGDPDIEGLYRAWLKKLKPLPQPVTYEPVSRHALQHFAATGGLPANPPPPSRPTIVPGGPRPPGTAAVHGHLPFQDVATATDIFYRFEAWPTSRRVSTGTPGTIAPGTFASPASELAFLPTGFSAVARNALPSFFPAVFRYELAPAAGANILCGAVVPMFGMTGGGVEVMLVDRPTTKNRGAIANPAVIPPL